MGISFPELRGNAKTIVAASTPSGQDQSASICFNSALSCLLTEYDGVCGLQNFCVPLIVFLHLRRLDIDMDLLCLSGMTVTTSRRR
jgi:hypothetical protein